MATGSTSKLHQVESKDIFYLRPLLTMYIQCVILYNILMDKTIQWSEEKNEWLKANRNISFEEIVEFIEGDATIKKAVHPNQAKYPHQQIYFIE